MVLRDHLNLTGTNPLASGVLPAGVTERFVDMSAALKRRASLFWPPQRAPIVVAAYGTGMRGSSAAQAVDCGPPSVLSSCSRNIAWPTEPRASRPGRQTMKFIAVFLALLLLPVSGVAQTAAPPDNVKLLINPSLIFDLPLMVAIDKGLFAQQHNSTNSTKSRSCRTAFRRRVRRSSPELPGVDCVQGDVDIAAISANPGFFNQFAQGFDAQDHRVPYELEQQEKVGCRHPAPVPGRTRTTRRRDRHRARRSHRRSSPTCARRARSCRRSCGCCASSKPDRLARRAPVRLGCEDDPPSGRFAGQTFRRRDARRCEGQYLSGPRLDARPPSPPSFPPRSPPPT